MPAPQTLKIGKDVAFVPPETALMMEEQVGGPKVAAQSAGEQIEATAHAAQQLDGQPEDALKQVYGRRAREAVRTEHGLIIVAPGQIITSQVIKRASSYNKQQELLSAVEPLPAQATFPQDQPIAQPAAGLEQAREGASNLWDRVKGKVSELQERSMQQVEQNRIDAAIGRPVSRVILDRQDRVMLNVGELITHEAVERARQAGVLSMLLDSVVHVQPTIAPEELRAPAPGSAALDQQERARGES